MTNAQRWVNNYINHSFGPESVKKHLVGADVVKITDKQGESLNLSINLFGDIMIAGTKTIVAESNLPHSLDKLRLMAIPTAWNDLPENWPKMLCELKSEKKQSVKAQISYHQSRIEKEEKKNEILRKEELDR